MQTSAKDSVVRVASRTALRPRGQAYVSTDGRRINMDIDRGLIWLAALRQAAASSQQVNHQAVDYLIAEYKNPGWDKIQCYRGVII